MPFLSYAKEKRTLTFANKFLIYSYLSLSMKFVASNPRQVYDIAKILIISSEMTEIRPKGLITLYKLRAMSCNATHIDENALVESFVFLAEISKKISK